MFHISTRGEQPQLGIERVEWRMMPP